MHAKSVQLMSLGTISENRYQSIFFCAAGGASDVISFTICDGRLVHGLCGFRNIVTFESVLRAAMAPQLQSVHYIRVLLILNVLLACVPKP